MILDIFLGIFIAKLTAIYFSVPLTVAMITGGIVFALLPDIDFVKLFFRKEKREGNKDYEHRDFLHYPVPYLIIGTLVVWFFGDMLWASIFFFATLLHFIHDSIGIGWGVKWLYPFSNKSFAFFYHYESARNNFPRKLVYSWTPKEVRELSRFGDKNWIKNIYFSFHPYSLAEHFITAVIIIFLCIL